MSAVKETLIKKIKQMSEAEAKRLWDMADQIRSKERSLTLERLAQDPLFKVPDGPPEGFSKIKPAKGKGLPASKLLIMDRR